MFKRSVLLGLAALLIMGGSAYAYTGSVHLKVTVPFDFNVGLRSLPAGDYYINSFGNNGMLTIKNADGTTAKQGYVYSLPVELLDASKATTVSFTCYGNQCFLSEIRTQGSTLGAQLLAGHKEKLLAKRGLETSVPVLASIR